MHEKPVADEHTHIKEIIENLGIYRSLLEASASSWLA